METASALGMKRGTAGTSKAHACPHGRQHGPGSRGGIDTIAAEEAGKNKVMKSLWTILLCLCMAISVAAQGGEFEVGGVAGYGGVIGEDVRDQSYGYGGAFFQTRLGRPEVKVDYEYHAWDRLGPLHMIGVGWLIQAKPRKSRPFFQVGWVWAFERHRVRGTFPGRLPDDPPVFVDRSITETLQGLALGAGVTLDVGNRFFIRPELRWRGLGPGPMMMFLPAVSVGVRF